MSKWYWTALILAMFFIGLYGWLIMDYVDYIVDSKIIGG